MSNSIARPRKRPRVASLNFRVLWWLVAREAAFQVYRGWYGDMVDSALERELSWERTGRRWRQRASMLLRAYPHLRILP